MCLANDGKNVVETAVYCTDVGGDGITRGFQNLVNGKYMFENSAQVTDANDKEPPVWNGVLIGAVLAQ